MFLLEYILQKISHSISLICFDIQWHLFPGINCITDFQELNIWIRRVVIFKTFLKLKQKNMSSFIQSISVFTKDFNYDKT